MRREGSLGMRALMSVWIEGFSMEAFVALESGILSVPLTTSLSCKNAG